MLTWRQEVANVRVHGTTGQVPYLKWQQERPVLQPLPPPYTGVSPKQAVPRIPEPDLERFSQTPFQHALAAYEQLVGGL